MIEKTPQSRPESFFTARHFLYGLIGLLAAIALVSALIPRPRARASDLTAENILQAVNKERSVRNILTLNQNGKLFVAAAKKAQDMVVRHYFSHTDPEGNYIWPTIVSEGYTPYAQLGENLAIEFYDTDSLLSAWMNSPTHRANILNEGFKDQGMGLSFGDTSQSQYYSSVANTFGTLMAVKKPAPTAPAAPKTVAPKPAAPKKSAPKKTVPKKSTKTSEVPAPPVVASAQDTTFPAPGTPEDRGTETQNLKTLSMRGEDELPSFTTAQVSSSPASALHTEPISVPAQEGGQKTKVNITLLLGLVLLLLMLLDIRNLKMQDFLHLDKKINNFVLLLLSILVCAFLYWI